MSNYVIYIPEPILCELLHEAPIRASRSYKQQGKLNEPRKLCKPTKKQPSTRVSR